MFTCGTDLIHQHEKVEDAKVCYGLLPRKITLPSWQKRVYLGDGTYGIFGDRAHLDGPLSKPQYDYIIGLRGNSTIALSMTYSQASSYISDLQGGSRVTSGSVTDPKLAIVAGMLDMVDEGYYAVELTEGAHVSFIRMSRPKKGKFKGSTKFQLITGSGFGKKLEVAAVLWPSGQWSTYEPNMVEPLMLLVADPHTAALRYGERMKCCCRCNADLTDGYSRWFRIGPECTKHWPWVEQTVLATRGRFTGER